METHITAAEWLVIVVVSLIIGIWLAGCGGTTGWQFQVGVNPITAVSDHQELNGKELRNGQRRNK